MRLFPKKVEYPFKNKGSLMHLTVKTENVRELKSTAQTNTPLPSLLHPQNARTRSDPLSTAFLRNRLLHFNRFLAIQDFISWLLYFFYHVLFSIVFCHSYECFLMLH